MTYIIAELGSCHDGHLQAMYEGVHVAKECGADACKLQWTSDPERMAARRGKALEDGYGEIYRRYLAWPAEWHALLRAECDRVGIDYLCTAYLPADVAVIAPHVRHFKIASFEAEDEELCLASAKAAEGTGRWVIKSLGMGAGRGDAMYWQCARFLHCVSAYPAPHAAFNLRRLWEPDLSSGLFQFDGLSDHTAPHLTWTGALAVAAGADIVEAHFRLLHTEATNPDYPHAMSPDQFKEYCANIRFAEECLGTGDTSMQECERAMARYKIKGEPTTERTGT